MKIIMVTGQVTPEIEKSALEAGAHECINKPINLEALLEKLALSSQSDAVSS